MDRSSEQLLAADDALREDVERLTDHDAFYDAFLDVLVRWTTIPASPVLTVAAVVFAVAWFGRGTWYRLYLAARGEHINDRP